MVNSASVPGDVIYIAGQPRYNHTGQVIIYRMNDGNIEILQRISGEQVSVMLPLKHRCAYAGHFHKVGHGYCQAKES